MDEIVRSYGKRVGFSQEELERFHEEGHRVRHVRRLGAAAALYTIEAEVIKARHCNSGHATGQKIILDVDGNLIAKLCPKKICIYLVSQLAIPVAQINERLSEGLPPRRFSFHAPGTLSGCGSGVLGIRRGNAEGQGGSQENLSRRPRITIHDPGGTSGVALTSCFAVGSRTARLT